MLPRKTPGHSRVTLDGKDLHSPNLKESGMSQLQITKQSRTASARRRGQVEPLLPLDPRDPEIIRAKQLQRKSRQPSSTR